MWPSYWIIVVEICKTRERTDCENFEHDTSTKEVDGMVGTKTQCE